MTFSTAIIGLGNIGMRYDLHLPEADFTMSHARAFAKHSGFILSAGADPDSALQAEFVNHYHAPAFPSVTELLNHTTPDVIVIASPTQMHREIVSEILKKYRPKVILCEKPLAYETVAAREMVELCRERQVLLLVNFIRRADPGVLEAKAMLESGKIITPFKAVVWYSKGLIHNGSHMVDLLIFWFGPIQEAQSINSGRALGKYDGEPDFQLKFSEGSAIFCAAKEENFSYYLVDVITENGRLQHVKGGVFWQESSPHPRLNGYRELSTNTETLSAHMHHYQLRVLDQLVLALRGKENSLCTAEQALENGIWLDKIVNLAPA